MIWPWRRERTFAQRGEDLAARHLRQQGYRILERNVRLAGCEIDIIAQEGDTIAFVEVKTRRDNINIAPEDSIGPTKQRHICRAAHAYIDRRNDPNLYYRFDTVSIILPENAQPRITLLRDAFQERR